LTCNRLAIDHKDGIRLIQRHDRIDIACIERIQEKNVDVSWIVPIH
jgi:hypothetical protein